MGQVEVEVEEAYWKAPEKVVESEYLAEKRNSQLATAVCARHAFD